MTILRKDQLAADPVVQFEHWYGDAERCGTMPLYMACCLATVDADGRPAARMVLLKGFDQEGFVFYTHLRSPKGAQLSANPAASLVFYWVEQRRQVRVEGHASEVASDEADAYFRSRDRESQIGAWASRQSEPIATRDVLEERVARYAAEFDGRSVPRPDHWSGYRLRPDRVEFWQEQPARLHDRFLYRRQADGSWAIERLCP
ncbi:MAG: pyridoxamine 5'-phosphate oxidase [Myxococcales bacterium]|nr:pyridoxamine 5'-phosphate oxidase [Myxococcales bacterium]